MLKLHLQNERANVSNRDCARTELSLRTGDKHITTVTADMSKSYVDKHIFKWNGSYWQKHTFRSHVHEACRQT